MAELFHSPNQGQRMYWDRQQFKEFDDQLQAVRNAKTVYVGNLSIFTTESQIHESFSRAGPVKRVIMGLNSYTKTPCGFCFVEYYKQEHALNCLKFITNTVCDDQIIRCELDAGFVPGRQYGRGKRTGGQMRDDRRVHADSSRGELIRYEGDGSTEAGAGARPGPEGARGTGKLSGGFQIVKFNRENNSSSSSASSSSSSSMEGAPTESAATVVPAAGERRKRGREDDDDDN